MTYYSVSNNMVIRPMRTEDLEQVRVIDKLSFSMPWPESAYEYELKENSHSIQWVAELNPSESSHQILGMIVVWIILDEAHIATIGVHPEFRGQGVAGCLVVAALKDAIQNGAHHATLEVRAHNVKAQNLYRKFGFEVVGQRTRYYRDNNEDALIMTINNVDEIDLEKIVRCHL